MSLTEPLRARRPAPPAIVTFVLVAVALTALALEGGGAYDIVVRQRDALLLWWIIALSAAGGLLPGRRPSRPGLVVLGALVTLLLWTAASLAWTSSDERTLVEVARVAAHLGVLALLVTVLGPATWRAAVAGATLAAVVVCALAFAARLHPGLLGVDGVAENFGPRRLSVPFGYWNAVGAWAGMTSALCLAWSAHARHAAARGLALAAIPLTVAVSYLTYSRASLGGTVLGLLVVVALSRNRWTLILNAGAAAAGAFAVVLEIRNVPAIAEGTGSAGAGRVAAVVGGAAVLAGLVAVITGRLGADRLRIPPRRSRVALLVGVVIGVVAAAGLAVTVGPDAWRQFKTQVPSVAGADPAARLTNLNGSRYKVWSVAVQTGRAHPWKGTGAGTFEFAWNRAARTGEFVRDGHSLYLEPFAELGWPGALIVLAFVAGIIAAMTAAVRHTRADSVERGVIAAAGGAIAAYLFGAGFDWLWESTAVTVLALVLVGGVVALRSRDGTAVRLPARVALVGFAVLAGLLQLPGLVSTSEVRRSQAASTAGRPAVAREHADEAVAAQPWAASPFVQRALVAEQQGDLPAARADLLRAARREPQDWRAPLLLARVEAEADHSRAAVAAYRRAKALRPLGRFFRAQR